MSHLKSINEIIVYQTIDDRILVYVGKNNDSRYQVDPDIAVRWLNWLKILEQSRTNQSLDLSIQQLETIYGLVTFDSSK
jgi:hypothetical protein